MALGGIGLFLLYACQDGPPPTEPEAAAAQALRTFTLTGSGTGSGTVTSTPAGLHCTITAGQAAATGCQAKFNVGVLVSLTATAKPGHAFGGWFGFCQGEGSCRAKMSGNRAVDARFLQGPFTIRIAGGGAGTGSGTVKSQAGLTPAIHCVVTHGAAAASGCAADYPAGTTLTLTATATPGGTFSGWGTPCSGTGGCSPAVVRSRTLFATFAPSGTSLEAIRGKWEPAFSTPGVAIHLHQLPTGKVLFWGEQGEAQLWDPAHPGAGFTTLTKSYPVFCSGHTFLPDGRLLVTGGNIAMTGAPKGDNRGAIFDPVSGGWSAAAPMAQGRYYPTLLTLPSGRILALSGADEKGAVVGIPEIGDGQTWRRLTTAMLQIPAPYYPATFLAPNGKVFLAGFPPTSRYLSVSGNGGWTTVGPRIVADRTMGSAVMYAPGKILYAGGGEPPTNSAEVINLNQTTPSWRSVPGMRFARRQMNATLLPDGQVLVTGGSAGAGFNDVTAPVREAELWNPATESWALMARESVVRTYHSTAILLPDARVLSSGSGEGGGVVFEESQRSAQIFNPPYLFNPDGTPAHRPAIASAPAHLGYGQPVVVQSPDAGAVSRGSLVRLSSVTHAFNRSQLIFPLAFSPTGATSLQAAGPASANLAPPGPYMLFLVSSKGVPSVAKMVTVGP